MSGKSLGGGTLAERLAMWLGAAFLVTLRVGGVGAVYWVSLCSSISTNASRSPGEYEVFCLVPTSIGDSDGWKGGARTTEESGGSSSGSLYSDGM